MPDNTAPAASATGIPEPMGGAGAPTRRGAADAAVIAPMNNPLANANNLIPTSADPQTYLTVTNDEKLHPNIMYQFGQVVCLLLTSNSPISACCW